MTVGFRIAAMPPRPSKGLIQGFAEMVTPHISDNMARTQAPPGRCGRCIAVPARRPRRPWWGRPSP